MKVQNSSTDNRPTVTGFPVDVFNEVMAMLPYKVPYEFIQYNDNGYSPGYYDSLISQVYFKASLDVSLELPLADQLESQDLSFSPRVLFRSDPSSCDPAFGGTYCG